MNEVTKINLGRQVFTIAADAHHELRNYLDSIQQAVSDKDVIDEVEARMAEILTERGLGEEKVVLKKDVDYLKKQLGSPKDFKDDSQDETAGAGQVISKRLYRDTDNAMIAGVAAGLSRYFGVDVWLFRLLFIVLLLVTFGGGIVLYILLWILVPEAKTTSDRLQMAGKPITVESLKQIAKNTDVKGAAQRANASLAEPINRAFSIFLKIVGIVMMAFGLAVTFTLIAGLVYFLTKNSIWAQYNIFPVGTLEHILLYAALGVAGLAAVFIIIFGAAILRRKWPIPAWITGILAGLLLIGFAVCGALSASVYPTVRDAYNANLHTTVRAVQPFDSVSLVGDNAWGVTYDYSNSSYVTMDYFGKPDLSSISTSVKNNVLTIDTSRFDWHRNCKILCVPDTYNLNITVHSPNFSQLQNAGPNLPAPPFASPKPMRVWAN